MPRTSCPLCGSTDLEIILQTTGPHYARRVCRPGRHFVEWVPRPRETSSEIPPALADLIVSRRKPASLRGSEKQVAAAQAIRARMVAAANQADREDVVRMLACIADASWFLANKGLLPPNLKCWPRPDQMERSPRRFDPDAVELPLI